MRRSVLKLLVVHARFAVELHVQDLVDEYAAGMSLSTVSVGGI